MPMPDPLPETPKSRIRSAFAARLAAEIPEVGGRVYASRVVPTDRTHWPCMLVTTDKVDIETTDRMTPGRRPQERQVSVIVTIIDDGEPEASLDDRLDWLALRVEQAVMAEPHFEDANGRAAVEDINLAMTQTSIVPQRGAVRGQLQMLWVVSYRTIDGSPATTLGR